MKNGHSVSTRVLMKGLLAAALAGALGTAAAADDFVFTPIDEIPEGRGLITDESGEFTIFKWDRSKKNTSESQETPTRTAPAPAPSQTITSTSGITEAPTPE